MSSSYSALNQKYNTLLALVLDGSNIGSTINGTLLTSRPVVDSILATVRIESAGIYILTFNLLLVTSTKGTTNTIVLSGSGVNIIRYGATNPSLVSIGFSGSQVITATANTDYIITLNFTNSTFSNITFPAGFFTATKIG